jgi:hypothetical protein
VQQHLVQRLKKQIERLADVFAFHSAGHGELKQQVSFGFSVPNAIGPHGTAYSSNHMWDSTDFFVRLTAKTATLCCRSDTVDLECSTTSEATFSELGFRYDDSGQIKRSLEIGWTSYSWHP